MPIRRFVRAALLLGPALALFPRAADAQALGGPPRASLGAFVLRPSEPAEPVVIPQPIDEPSTGRVVREPPVPEGQTTDDVVTGGVPGVPRAPIDPYEPLGIAAGGFVLYPSLTLAAGATTNAASAAGGGSSAFIAVSPELSLRSNWARNAATFDFSGSFQHFLNNAADDQPEVAALATAQIDASSVWTVPVAGAYRFTTQPLSDPDFPAGVDRPPGVHELRGSIGIDRAGPVILQADARFDRSFYENGTSGVLIVDQGDRTNTFYGGRLRVGYAVGPSLAPFVEAEVGRRQFDRTVDSDGVQRSGLLQGYRLGVTVDRGPVLSGEVALGYGIATFDDPALASFGAFTADGNVVWAPTRLTTVTLDAATTFDPSTDPASSGAIVYNGSLDLAYAWRDNVTLTARAALRNERFQGTGQVDTESRAGLAGTWKLNRMLWLTAVYEHEWLTSTDPTRPFQSDAVRVELRAQR